MAPNRFAVAQMRKDQGPDIVFASNFGLAAAMKQVQIKGPAGMESVLQQGSMGRGSFVKYDDAVHIDTIVNFIQTNRYIASFPAQGFHA